MHLNGTPRTLLFDCDGTLLNTLPLIVHCFSAVSERFNGEPMTDEQVLARFGPTETEMIRRLLADENDYDAAVAHFYDAYQAHHAEYIEGNEQLFALLRRLREGGHRLGMVTGKARRSLTLDLQRFHLEDLFDVLITGDDVTKPKPAPEGLLKAMAQLNAKPETTLYVGDSNDDMEAAHAAGITAVAAQWLDRPQTSHYACKPDYIVKSADDLLDVLDDLAH